LQIVDSVFILARFSVPVSFRGLPGQKINFRKESVCNNYGENIVARFAPLLFEKSQKQA
jgi:hypothetical protein